MRTRIIDGQPFRRGGGVEGLIGGDQRHWTPPDLLVLLADFKDGSQLHGIIGPKATLTGEPTRCRFR